jgi:4-amino-4-deoxy-L-arabinose transferase-like glycosyltransferase
MNAPDPQQSMPRTLALIRAALLIGVFVFGLIAWFLTRSGGLAALDPPVLALFRSVLAVALVIVAVGLIVLRRKRRERSSYQGKASYTIIGWALAEFVAFGGGVCFIITGNALYYLLGFALLFAANFVMLPLPEQAR